MPTSDAGGAAIEPAPARVGRIAGRRPALAAEPALWGALGGAAGLRTEGEDSAGLRTEGEGCAGLRTEGDDTAGLRTEAAAGLRTDPGAAGILEEAGGAAGTRMLDGRPSDEGAGDDSSARAESSSFLRTRRGLTPGGRDACRGARIEATELSGGDASLKGPVDGGAMLGPTSSITSRRPPMTRLVPGFAKSVFRAASARSEMIGAPFGGAPDTSGRR